MNRKAADMPIQTIAIILIVLLAVVAIAVFFFAGLQQQGGVLTGIGGNIATEGQNRISSLFNQLG